MLVEICDVMGQDREKFFDGQEKFSAMEKETFNARLREIRKALALTQKEFATRVGLKEHQIKDAEIGKTKSVPRQALKRIETEFNINLEYLEYGIGSVFKTPAESDFTTPGPLKAFTVQCGPTELDFTPVVKIKALVSGGQGDFVYEEACEEIYSFRTDWLHRKGTVSAMRLAEVSGDSMLPTLSNGDFVLFDTSKREPRDGKIMVIGIDNHLLIKRIRISPDGVYLLSDNRAVYEPVFARPENTRFLGLAIWHCGDI